MQWKRQYSGETLSMKNIQENAKLASNFLKGMANETRLVILCALAEGEKNVSELEDILGIRQPTLSQQLTRLGQTNWSAHAANPSKFFTASPARKRNWCLACFTSCSAWVKAPKKNRGPPRQQPRKPKQPDFRLRLPLGGFHNGKAYRPFPDRFFILAFR